MAPCTFVFVPVGSHGDVHPLLGLALALKSRGHRCLFCANGYFRAMIAGRGLDFIELGSVEQYLDLTSRPEIWHPRKGPLLLFSAIGALLRPAYQVLLALWQQQPLVLVASPLCLAARLLHETHAVPLVTTQLQPMALRSAHEPVTLPGLPPLRLPPGWLRQVQRLLDAVLLDPVLCPPLNALRAELGLAPVRRVLAAWANSPQRVLGLWPSWFAAPAPDWPTALRLVGFPLFDEGDSHGLSPRLQEFLAAGAAPLVFTPGSAMRQGQAFFATAVAVCERLGQRGILLTRFPEQLPTRLPASVLADTYAPFAALLPRCAALIHHGGIGTLAQGLSAGLPQLVMPLAFDQHDNLRRLRELGVGDGIVPRQFTLARVSRMLQHLLQDAEVAAHCARARRSSAGHDGLRAACESLEAVALEHAAG